MKQTTVYTLIRIGFIFFAILALSSIVVLTMDSIRERVSLIHIYGFFTVQSNLFITVMFVVSSLWFFTKRNSEKLVMLRGASTLYMIITGIVYFALLRDVRASFVREWVNIVVHGIMPVAAFVEWIAFPPTKKISYMKALIWLIYPALYLIYSMIRGTITGIYPYSFLDPNQVGYVSVLQTSLVIAIGFLCVTWFILHIGMIAKKYSAIVQKGLCILFCMTLLLPIGFLLLFGFGEIFSGDISGFSHLIPAGILIAIEVGVVKAI